MPTFGSLFAGIGGIDLGLERAGWTCRWQVEWDAYCQRVLAKHWPDVPRYGDITTVDWSGVERVDLLAGGFPCQPVSVAGKRAGQDDDRWLWPAFADAIRVLRPRLVLVENVPGLLARGMGNVLADLAALGYDSEWDCIPASAVGAPHRRDRLWLVGYRRELGPSERVPNASRTELRIERERNEASERSNGWPAVAGYDGTPRDVAYPQSKPVRPGLRPSEPATVGWGRSGDGGGARDATDTGRERGQLPAERQHPAVEVTGRDDPTRGTGFRPGQQWATEPNVGRVAHGVPARVDRLRALGNAVVPQVVEVIGRQLLATTPVSDDTEGAG